MSNSANAGRWEQLSGLLFLVILIVGGGLYAWSIVEDRQNEREAREYYYRLDFFQIVDACGKFQKRLNFHVPANGALDLAYGDFDIQGDHNRRLALIAASWSLYCTDAGNRPGKWELIDSSLHPWFYGTVDEQVARIGEWIDTHQR